LVPSLGTVVLLLLACTDSNGPHLPGTPLAGIHRIRHVVIIMQENRSFDSYFGTYPGADGLPMLGNGTAGCVPDAELGHCVRSYPAQADKNFGGPHSAQDASLDIDAGRMDGFIARAEAKMGTTCNAPGTRACSSTGPTDVMGYHDQREIPNYWSYAQNFVLQD